LEKIKDPENQETEYQYNLIGHITEEDRNGNTIAYSYDGLGHLLEKSITEDNETYKIKNTYDYMGNRKTAQVHQGGQILYNCAYNYNEIGMPISETIGTTNKTYTYDANGNRKSFILKKSGVDKINSIETL
jgi:YD repeat-containing protein